MPRSAASCISFGLGFLLILSTTSGNSSDGEYQGKDDSEKKENQRDPVVAGHGWRFLARLFRRAAFEAICTAAPGLNSTSGGAGQAQQSHEAIAELDQFEDFHVS